MGALRRILHGLRGLGIQKVAQKMETIFTPSGRMANRDFIPCWHRNPALGALKLPADMCGCTGWSRWRKNEWVRTCRGPGHLRFVLTVRRPGIEYKRVWKGKSWESGFNWRTVHHAAEVELDTYEARNGDVEVSPRWKHRSHRAVGYFKTLASAKRRAHIAAMRSCNRAATRTAGS